MEHISSVAIAITAVTAAASLLSVIGSAFVLICYAVLPPDRHFRHILILNLATSDFLNSLNNSVAGLYILSHKRGLDPGQACIFNGFVGQVTVQATDCAILAIAITTIFAITRKGRISTAAHGGWLWGRMVLLCCVIWTFPFITGFLALGMGWYAPATGNWCWIKAKPIYLRYVLTHGWRFLFIITEICLYIYLDIYLRRHYQKVAEIIPPQGATPFAALSEPNPGSVSSVMFSPKSSHRPSLGPVQQDRWHRFWSPSGLRKTHRISGTFSANVQYQAIQRALLLNAYPLAYIILWLPGIANRLIEATGHSSRVMQFLQATTQLVGLANALTYGWNERVAKQLKERLTRRT